MTQTYATKWRELKAREETVTAREEELKKREEAVAQQESALQEREKALLHNQQQHHHHQQQQQQQYGAPAGTVMDEHQQQQHIGNSDFERRLQQHASKPRRASTEQMVVDRRQSIDMMSVAEGPSRRQSTEAMTVDDGCRDGDSDGEQLNLSHAIYSSMSVHFFSFFVVTHFKNLYSSFSKSVGNYSVYLHLHVLQRNQLQQPEDSRS